MAQPVAPIGGADGDELDVARFFAQDAARFEKQLFLQVAGDITGKGTVLNAIQAVIQAGIRDFGAGAVVRDVVDE